MIRQIANLLGRFVLRRTVATGAQKGTGGNLDPKFGLRLLRDGRVPVRSKLTALALGLAALFVLEVLELPLQTVLAFLLPMVGVAADFAIDGIELLAGPLLVASLTLPWIAPKDIVEKIRDESEGRVYQATEARIS